MWYSTVVAGDAMPVGVVTEVVGISSSVLQLQLQYYLFCIFAEEHSVGAVRCIAIVQLYKYWRSLHIYNI